MEVHAHAHTERKKFKHYLWEFVMLFLAVFCGFIAENLRERNVESHRAKQYIASIAEDLSIDIYSLDSITQGRQHRDVVLDSLFNLLDDPNREQHGADIYFYARGLTYFFQFVNNDRTIQQLKNSGNFRLIHDTQISDKIMDYDRQLRWIAPTNAREELMIEKYIDELPDFFDTRVFQQMLDKKFGFHKPSGNPRLLSIDPAKLQRFMNTIHFLKAINIFMNTWQERQKARAENILDYIRKEYHLK